MQQLHVGCRKESVLVGVYLRQAVRKMSGENECEAEDIEMWSVRVERRGKGSK